MSQATNQDIALYSLKTLLRTPVKSLLIWHILAIAYLLPMLMICATHNFSKLIPTVHDSINIHVFLQKRATHEQAEHLTQNLKEMQFFKDASLISADQGLRKFADYAEIDLEVLKQTNNPLPHSIELTLRPEYINQADAIFDELNRYSMIESIKMDSDWIQKAQSILSIAEKFSNIFTLSLMVGALLIIFTLIKFNVSQDQSQIQIHQLLGATRSYIRRPYTFKAIWLSMGGCLIALLWLEILLLWFNFQIVDLARLYQSQFLLDNYGITGLIAWIGLSLLLAYIGSFVAVNQELEASERAL